MSNRLELVAKGGILRLILDKWCKCYLVSGEEIYLGADTIDVVISKLLTITSTNPIQTPYRLESTDVGNVLNLSEAHHCLYATNYYDTQKLFWQDASINPVKIVGMQELTDMDRAIWRRELEKLQNTINLE